VRTRRAETTREIPSGGSMAMAGLIQQQTKQAVNGTRRRCLREPRSAPVP
jgi:Flp pilus assembly secretin CpaC